MFDSLPKRVSIYEVSPRDGLQNESAQVATHAKVRLVEALVVAGLRRIEVSSFVSAKWVPQMADADQVFRMLETMDSREATVVRMRFGLEDEEPKTLKEIGLALGLTRERVRQIENEALGKLAENLVAE